MSEDLISRQAAIRLITGYNGVMDKSVAKRLLIQMPSAQPERKRGHWIPWDGDDCYECSACGVLWTFLDGSPEENEANFCPHCGADMRERDEQK